MNNLKRMSSVFSNATWRRLIVAFVIVAVPMFLFVGLADEVRDNDTLAYDEFILRAVNAYETPALDAAVVGFTQLGGVIGVMALTIGITALLWVRGFYKKAAILVTGVGGAALLNVLLKSAFQRDRPELWERIVTENSYSFPSGHAMASGALALSIMVIFWPTRWRWLSVIIGVLYMVGIALTRLYLGVHYPTDILAGWLVSAAWVGSTVFVLHYRQWMEATSKNINLHNS